MQLINKHFRANTQYYRAYVTSSSYRVEMLTINQIINGWFKSEAVFTISEYEGTCRRNLLKVKEVKDIKVKIGEHWHSYLKILISDIFYHGIRWSADDPMIKSLNDLPPSHQDDTFNDDRSCITSDEWENMSLLMGSGFNMLHIAEQRQRMRDKEYMELLSQKASGKIGERDFYKRAALLGYPYYIQRDIIG